MDDHNTITASIKISVAWAGALFGTLSEVPLTRWVLLATLIFTLLQTWKLILELKDRRARKAAESKAFAEKLSAPQSPEVKP